MFAKQKNDLGIDWGKFYRNVIALVVPMALQNLINVSIHPNGKAVLKISC